MAQKHWSTCPLCEATCGIEVQTEGRRVLSIRGDKLDVFSKGYICPKAAALEDLYSDPDRLRKPLRRTKGGWQTLSWEGAFDEVAQGIQRIQNEHGRHAMSFYLGNPSVHNLGILTLGQLFLRTVRTKNRYSATSADQLPHMLAAQQMFGNQLRMPVPDIDRCDFFLILGGNPLVSNGSIMTAPNMRGRIASLRARGGKVVVVDPRNTQTAKAADRHVCIRPGSDALFLLALAHCLFDNNLVAPGRLAEFTDGIDAMRKLSLPYSPEAVAEATGVAPATIAQLAQLLAQSKAPAVYGRLGVCAQEFGGLAAWLINVINILIGSLDQPGGMMFPKPAVDLPANARRLGLLGHYDRYRSRVRGLPEFGGEFPVSTMADEMLEPGEGQIRGLMSIAGNPVLSSPNGRKLERALSGLDFMVSVDPYINETTKHANIILPPTSPLEREHYDLAFDMFKVRNVAKFSPAVFPREAEQRHDWEIFAELWSRLQPGANPLQRGKRELFRRTLLKAGPRAIVAAGLALGPYKLSLRKLLRAPHGIDLGALQPALPAALETPRRRIQLVPEIYQQDLERLDKAHKSGDTSTLRLIGRRQLRSNNSWLHNSQRLVKGKARCTLLVHPDDALKHKLSSGDMARIESKVGWVVAAVQIDLDIMPGVVSLPHGWGHTRSSTKLRVAEAHPGVSLNDLSDDAMVDQLSGNAVLNGIPVQLSKEQQRTD